ncbi:MAG TPA: hypothetical protein DDW49_11085 [Deltaproteobacteria bacterium]|nr:MAG: hypothetical protein A2048_02040 [Deltaproteobacteria bacterium GWA2_45_12]HBF13909.1 hypothetical protein [Deltaproteobacteria bacterium]
MSLFPLHIALRFFKSHSSRRFVLFLSVVSFLSMAFSVCAVLLIQAVTSGFSSSLEQAMIGFRSHLELVDKNNQLTSDEVKRKVAGISGIESIEEVVEAPAILKIGDGQTYGVMVRATHFDQAMRAKYRAEYFDEWVASDIDENEISVFVGRELLSRMQVFPSGMEEAELINPVGDVGPLGDIEPTLHKVKLAGFFSTGFFEADSHYLLAPMGLAPFLTSGQPPSKIFYFYLKDGLNAQSVQKQIQKIWPDAGLTSWKDKSHKLYRALVLERMAMFLLLAVALLLACLNVGSLVGLLVEQHQKDMGVLYATGLDRIRLKRIFASFGLLLGGLGSLFGVFMAVVLMNTFFKRPLHLPDAYFVKELVLQPHIVWFFVVLLFVPLMAFLASLWPLKSFRRFNLSEILRAP